MQGHMREFLKSRPSLVFYSPGPRWASDDECEDGPWFFTSTHDKRMVYARAKDGTWMTFFGDGWMDYIILPSTLKGLEEADKWVQSGLWQAHDVCPFVYDEVK